ncbi:MAG: YebC/PmpR family DNA-binding transcriptional regulator [Erysipelotrichaceae bacterium]|nr:YebC/PmpR family DNA-binding transcriptional regulator [Erysipelotrichaceae bacterium]
MGRAHEVRAASMAKTAAAKTKVYSRYGKEIYMAAKSGVPDPSMNVALKRVIEKAKANQVPADVIKRNIEKAKGGNAEAYIENRYEGFGPSGSTILVETLSDNSNRTLAEVRSCFNKSHCNLGQSGSVSFNYESNGILSFEGTEDETLDILMMADVDVKDIEEEDGNVTVYVDPKDLYNAKDALEASKGEMKFDVLEISMLPNDYVTLDGDDKMLFERLLRLLDDVDDVQHVYHNVEGM